MKKDRASPLATRRRGIPNLGLEHARRGLRPAKLDAADIEVDLDAVPVLHVDDTDVLDAEELSIAGAAPKVWLAANPAAGRPRAYIAKAPGKMKKGSRLAAAARECVSEHMLAVIGKSLPLRVADWRLVRLRTPKRDHGIRFMSEYFLQPHEELLHGIDLLAMWLDAEREELESSLLAVKEEERDVYRLDYLVQMLHDTAVDGEAPALLPGLGRMLAMDAVIGANDRHAMNWGVIRNTVEKGRLRFSPVFDTARGLFWDYFDRDLRRVDDMGRREERVAKYAEGSRPTIGFRGWREYQPYNHFALIEHILYEQPGPLRTGVLDVIQAFRPDDVGRDLRRTTGRLVSRRRLEWIQALLHDRHARLAALLRDTL